MKYGKHQCVGAASEDSEAQLQNAFFVIIYTLDIFRNPVPLQLIRT
jgi:hypothetical protein